jgi:hypothetical protein
VIEKRRKKQTMARIEMKTETFCITFKFFKESGTYRITGPEKLLKANHDLLRPLWSPVAHALVATNREQLERLISELQLRNVSVHENRGK